MTKKTTGKLIKNDLKKNLPELISEPETLKPLDPGPQMLKAEEWLRRYPAPDGRKTRWFWMGVVGFAALIGIMWLITIRVQMSALAKRQSTDSDLFSKTKNNWDALFAERDKKISEQNIKTALTTALAALASASQNVATTATSTVRTSGSTPTIATSTTY